MKVQANPPQRQVIILVAPTTQKAETAPSFSSSINAAYKNSARNYGANGHKLNLMA